MVTFFFFFSVQCYLVLIYYFSMEKLLFSVISHFSFEQRQFCGFKNYPMASNCLLEKVVKYFLLMSSFEKNVELSGYEICYCIFLKFRKKKKGLKENHPKYWFSSPFHMCFCVYLLICLNTINVKMIFKPIIV